MLTAKWKFLIVSIIAYNALLTWRLYSLVNTSTYMATDYPCDTCHDERFGFILRNQGAWDTTMLLVWLSVLIVIANAVVWIVSFWTGRSQAPDSPPAE